LILKANFFVKSVDIRLDLIILYVAKKNKKNMRKFLEEKSLLLEESPLLFYTEEEFLFILSEKFSNRKAKAIDILNFQNLIREFEISSKPIELTINGNCIIYCGNVLFVLNPTNCPKHNCNCVIRDLLNIFFDGKCDFHRKDIIEKIIYNFLGA
jgi:hypothetical protein